MSLRPGDSPNRAQPVANDPVVGRDDGVAEPASIERLGGEAKTSLTAVLGFDLATQTLVLPGRETRESWEQRGSNGVCFGCYAGYELASPGTRTPLIYREGPFRHTHFAHPPGRSPFGDGLRGETRWHLEGKEVLRGWAAIQPGVESARCEWIITGRERRADVIVQLHDGRQVALEAQRRLLTRDMWAARRNSYHQQGIRDIWFWSTEVKRPFSAEDPGVSVILDPPTRRAGLIVGQQPRPESRWFDNDLRRFVPHWPPVPGDRLLVAWASIDEWTLHDGQLRPPTNLQHLRNPGLTDIAQAAEAARLERRAAWQRRHAHADACEAKRRQEQPDLATPRRRARPAPRHPSRRRAGQHPSAPRPTCRVCGTVLADVLAPHGVHILCAPLMRSPN